MKNYALCALIALQFFFFSQKTKGQCPVQADAGPDIHYCQGDPNPQLEGSITGDALSFVWAPAAGLSSTTVLDPTVTITAMKTYTLTANGLQDNSILNGDFESGNSNFTSSYIYDPVSLWLEGRYTVTDNPNSVHPNFAACTDHTSGSGQMMVVNGAATAGAVVWGQTVTVVPNMTYRFSYWGCSVISSSPAQQIFRINGVNIGSTFTYPAATCQWQQFFVTWNSGAATSANLQLINQNTAASGNDFAIDDINFQKQCSDVDTVTVFYHPDALKTVNATICNGETYTVGTETFDASGNYLVNLQTSFGCDSLVQLNLTVINIDAEINPNDPFIDCQNPTVWLTSQGSVVPPGAQFLWTTVGGQIIGNPASAQVTAGSVGSYFLKLTYKNGQLTCIDTTSVVVTSAAALPVANAGPDMTIGCATPTATLAGSFTGGANFTANWTTPNGHFVNGQTTFSPIVDAAGMYILTVTNPANGCSDKDTVMVAQDLSVPIANAGAADTLDCSVNSIILNGTASTGANFQFLWSTSNGHFVGGTNTLMPTVDRPGQYFLLVSNTQNGCTAISSVTISIDTVKPDAHAGMPFTLDCLTSFDTIFGSSTTNFTPVWTTIGGHFVSGQNTFEPVVDEAGIYSLKISNPINHCESMVSVEIFKNTTLPVVDAGPTFLLTCTAPTATLLGNISSGGPNPEIEWTTVGGSFLSGGTTLTPTVGTPGTYVLTVVNPQNGCTATDQTTVTADPNIPTVTIATPDTLNCVFKKQQLQATTSGANFQINWTTTTGNIVDGANTLTPNIDEQGIYMVTVINPANGCSATNSVEVFEDKVLPIVVIDPVALIDCNNAGSLLNATNSSQGPQFSYQWTTANNGLILSGQNGLIAVAGNAGTYVLTIVNNDNGCSAMKLAGVFSNLNYPTADAGVDKTLGCLSPSIDLTAVYSSNSPNTTINWSTTTGGPIATPNSATITIDQPGVYVFTVIDNQNGCSTADSVEIFQNNNTPIVIIPQPTVLTCAITSIVLESTGSSAGNNFNYSWSTTGGNIVGATDTGFVEINKVGQYTLTILNTQNGCTNSETVNVSANTTTPPVDAGPAQVLDCQTTSLALTGQTTTGFQPAWSTQNGHILNGANSVSAQIDAAGWYFFTATNPSNGCSATDSVQVLPDAGAPVLTVGVSGILTCLVTQVQINSTATSTSGNTNFQINWTSPTGQFLSGQNSLTPIVNKPGNYLLSVKDLTNGCVSNSSINVVADISIPQVLLTALQEITCSNPTPSIVGVINTIGNDYTFQWSTTNGQLLGGLNSLMPNVGKVGTYFLTATDISNGCSASQSVLVNEDTQLPVISIAQAEPLTCLIASVLVDGSQSDFGVNFSIDWKTVGGNFLTGQNGLKPEVDKTGFYILSIKNLVNGCTNSDTIEVLENKMPPTVFISKPDTITCKINSVPIIATGSGQGVISAIWTTMNGQISGPANQLTITANKVGNYSIKITDAANGCTTTAQTTVFENKIPPAISIPNPGKLTCKDSILTVLTVNSSFGSPYSWDWTGPFFSFADTLNPKINKTGQYSLTITNEQNGCKSNQSIIISSDFTPPPIDLGNPKVLTCAAPTAFLGGATSPGGLLYNWTTLNGNILGNPAIASVEVDAVGTYFLTTTSLQNGCTSTGSVEVTETKLTGANFQAKSPTCAGKLGQILVKNMTGGTLPYRFSIDGGQNWQPSPDFPNLKPGNYPVVVEDAGGCRIDLAAFISPGSTIEINLEKEAEISLGDAYILSATTNVPTARLDIIQWTPDTTLSCGDCLKTIASPLVTTRYRLFVADTSGCDAEAFFLLKVVRPPVFAPNVLKNDGNFSENSHFTVFTDADAVLEVKKLMVFDRWGNVVFQQKNFPPNDPALGWPGDFRGKQMGNAVYVWWAEIAWIDGKTSFLKGDVTIVD